MTLSPLTISLAAGIVSAIRGVVVDGERGCIDPDLEARALKLAREGLAVRIEYYSPAQAEKSERLRLPYVCDFRASRCR